MQVKYEDFIKAIEKKEKVISPIGSGENVSIEHIYSASEIKNEEVTIDAKKVYEGIEKASRHNIRIKVMFFFPFIFFVYYLTNAVISYQIFINFTENEKYTIFKDWVNELIAGLITLIGVGYTVYSSRELNPKTIAKVFMERKMEKMWISLIGDEESYKQIKSEITKEK